MIPTYKNFNGITRDMKVLSSLVVSLVFVCLLLSFASAQQKTLGTYQQGSCITLYQTCANCTYVTMSSLILPNGSIGMGTTAMTSAGQTYTLPYCETQQLGEYIVNTVGDLHGVATDGNYNFFVTSSGQAVNQSWTAYLALMILGTVVLVFGIWVANGYFGYITGVLYLIGGIYMLIYGNGLLNNLYTQALGYSSLGLGLIIFIASAYSVLEENGTAFRTAPSFVEESIDYFDDPM